MKSFVFVLLLGFSVSVFGNESLILSNFRIENGFESRIYFDSSLELEGSSFNIIVSFFLGLLSI